jgi:hypothetical protein
MAMGENQPRFERRNRLAVATAARTRLGGRGYTDEVCPQRRRPTG